LPAFFALVRAVVEALGFFAIGYLDSDGDQSGVGALVVIAREDWAIAHGKKTTTTRQPAAIERLRAMASSLAPAPHQGRWLTRLCQGKTAVVRAGFDEQDGIQAYK
jgi:hypothetical protein